MTSRMVPADNVGMKHLVRELVPISVGIKSLIGVDKERPVAFGNYFWLSDGGRVLNMWAENLEAADIAFGLSGQVSALTWSAYPDGPRQFVFIDDERIPDDWYYPRLCRTGVVSPPAEVVQEWLAYKGCSAEEMEQIIAENRQDCTTIVLGGPPGGGEWSQEQIARIREMLM